MAHVLWLPLLSCQAQVSACATSRSGKTLPACAVSQASEFALLVQSLGAGTWLGYCCNASVLLHALSAELMQTSVLLVVLAND